MIEKKLIEMDYKRQLQRARDIRASIYVSIATLWAVAIWQSFEWWYLGAIVVSVSLIEIWYDNFVKQLIKNWRKEIDKAGNV